MVSAITIVLHSADGRAFCAAQMMVRGRRVRVRKRERESERERGRGKGNAL